MEDSPINWTINELRSYLIEHGLTDLDDVNRDEMVDIVSALRRDEMSIVGDVEGRQPMDFEEVNQYDERKSEAENFDSRESRINHRTPNRSVTDDVENNSQKISVDIDQVVQDEGHQTLIAEFCGVTGASADQATHLLEAMGWDLENAVGMYMEQHMEQENLSPQPAALTHSSFSSSSNHPGFISTSSRFEYNGLTGPSFPNSTTGDINPIFPDLEAMASEMRRHLIPPSTSTHTNYNNMTPSTSSYRQHVSDHENIFGGMGMAMEDDYDEDYSAMAAGGGGRRAPVQYDEDGVRAPDAVRQSRLISGPSDARMAGFLARAEDEDVTWLFPPPNHLSFPGPFQEARTLGREEKKWLLTNIQLHTEFDSQKLNRDTWTDEFIITLLRSNFVFWQRGCTSGDGREYMRRYNIQEGDLPRTAILDPRTGAEILIIHGYIKPDELAQTLLEFFDSNSFDSNVAPKIRVMDMRKLSAAGRSEEDEDLSQFIVDEDPSSSHNTTHNVAEPSLHRDEAKGAGDSSEREPKGRPVEEKSTTIITPTRKYFCALPEEPPVGDPDSTKISLKLANGKTVVRRFKKSELVEVLFSLVASQIPEANEGIRDFDIVTTFPTQSLMGIQKKSLEEIGILNSQVVMRWIG